MTDELHLDWSAIQRLAPLLEKYHQRIHEKEPIDLREGITDAASVLGIEDVEAFVSEKLHDAMGEGLGLAFDEEDSEAIAGIFSGACVPVANLLIDYAQGERSDIDLLEALEVLRGDNHDELQKLLQKSLGIPDDYADLLSRRFGDYLVSIYCFAAAFKIYQSAAKDAELAKERRIESERLSREAIARIEDQREEMSAIANNYLLERIVPFNIGIAAMDQAILENDDDGFIRANAELWRVFGRDSQFNSAAEFDDLMVSDEVFRL